MRFEPIVGRKLWFAPRRFGGWGWQPVSVEGWIIVAVYVVLVLTPIAWLDEDADALPFLGAIALATAGLLGICYLKGTSPGGRSAWAAYRRSRDGTGNS